MPALYFRSSAIGTLRYFTVTYQTRPIPKKTHPYPWFKTYVPVHGNWQSPFPLLVAALLYAFGTLRDKCDVSKVLPPLTNLAQPRSMLGKYYPNIISQCYGGSELVKVDTISIYERLALAARPCSTTQPVLHALETVRSLTREDKL